MSQVVRRMFCRSGVFCWLMLCIGLMMCPQLARGQDVAAAADPEWHFQFELFQMLLEQNELQTVSRPQALLSDPPRGVLVILGSLDGVISPRMVEAFCEGGGAVLIASDSAYSGGRLAEFRAGPVQTNSREDRYQGHSDCLQITNLDAKHPVMDGVGSLVVNRSGWLGKPRWFQPEWDVLARLPQSCTPRGVSTEPLMVEYGLSDAADPNGRLFLAADQSLFTNGMLWHGDNAILAINLSQLLCTGGRTQLCFVADGTTLSSVQQNSAMNPNSPPPLPDDIPLPEASVETLLKLGNSVIRNVEESNLANELLANRPRDMSTRHYKRYVYLALIAAAVVAFLWALFAATNAMHGPMPTRQMKTAHDLTSGRRIESAECGQAASMLARAMCRELTDSEDSAVWQSQLRHTLAVMPAVKANQLSQKNVAELLDLAMNPRNIHISKKRFETVGQNIQTIRKLHQQGLLQAEA